MRNNLHKGFQFYRLHLQLTKFSKKQKFSDFLYHLYRIFYIFFRMQTLTPIALPGHLQWEHKHVNYEVSGLEPNKEHGSGQAANISSSFATSSRFSSFWLFKQGIRKSSFHKLSSAKTTLVNTLTAHLAAVKTVWLKWWVRENTVNIQNKTL